MGSVSFVEKERLPLKVGLKWVSRTYGLGEGDSEGGSLAVGKARDSRGKDRQVFLLMMFRRVCSVTSQ